MRRRSLPAFVLAVVLLCLPGACKNSAPAPTGGVWPASTPEDQGVDSQALVEILGDIQAEKLDIHGLVLIRNGHLVLESYVHPYGPDTHHNIKSVSKSILSALVGIALREGHLESLDEPVAEYLPEYFPVGSDPRKRKITLRHLLTMTAGLDLDENGPKMAKVFRSDDWIGTTFDADVIAEPGARFEYSTPLSHTMSGVLTRATERSVLEYAREHLFGPLGIEQVQWAQDPRGIFWGGAELWLTPLDMAKFGSLYLHRGLWQGKSLVPSDWVDASTRQQLHDIADCQGYGYWWWLGADNAYTALGWGGQGIVVDPETNTVLAITAANHAHRDQIAEAVFTRAVESDEPMPSSPKSVAALEVLVRELQSPTPDAPPEPTAAARRISGKEYRIDGHPLIRTLRLDFTKDRRCWLSADTNQGKVKAEVGLDGLYRSTMIGKIGHMPEHNSAALRGEWVDKEVFAIEMHELGSPVVSTLRLRYANDEVHLETVSRPMGYRQILTGRLQRKR